MVLSPGTKLDHYEIRSLLGGGEMGEVYVAEDLTLHRTVAVRVLRSDLVADEVRLLRFKREASAASGLTHPNILTIYKFGQKDEFHFIVSEFIEGETLGARMSREPFQITEIIEIGIQVSSALGAAHAAGIVHRDINPDSVLLRPDRLIKVLDFGSAKLNDEQGDILETAGITAAGTETNTSPYMSPEQARGLEVDGRADIWSLGAMLYEMVAGCLPFAGDTANDLISEILKTEPPRLTEIVPGVHPELERIISKTLQKDREERYAGAKDLEQDLKSLKRRLEFEAELERTDGSRFQTNISGSQATPETTYETQVSTARTGETKAATTSSIEYVLTAIGLHKRGFQMGFIGVVLVIALGGWWLYRGSSRQRAGSLSGTIAEIVPFTTFSGSEGVPSFAPDGNRMAFSWNSEGGANTDIYVKQVGTEDLQRLTTDTAPDISPRWSPDGLYVAFLRQGSNDYTLIVVPSIGGKERTLAKLALVTPMRFDVAQVSWFPDSKSLAVSDRASPQDPFSIVRISMESGERRPLTTPGAETNGDLTPAVSPDGKTVAFRHFESGGVSEIYSVPVAGGAPTRVTSSELVKSSPAWTADGEEILYLAESGSSIGLWRTPAGGGTPVRLEGLGQTITSFALSPLGNRLAWTQTINDSNIWQAELSASSPQTARSESVKMLISSTKLDISSRYSPDGKKIAFASTRSGPSSIWMADSDGQRAFQLASFDLGQAGSPRWSPDGRSIVFDGRVEGNADLYVVPSDGGKPRRLTTEPSEDMVPNFSRDGQSLYFCSNRSGRRQIWKMPAAGGPAVQLTTGGGFDSVESPDGKFLYYGKERGQPGIWRIPVAGGQESLVIDQHQAGLWRQWAVIETGMFFITAETPDRPVVEFLTFATGKISPVMALKKKLPDTASGLSVSPDGRSLVWTQLDQVTSDIMLIDNFR